VCEQTAMKVETSAASQPLANRAHLVVMFAPVRVVVLLKV
jgi:hypothetical protein